MSLLADSSHLDMVGTERTPHVVVLINAAQSGRDQADQAAGDAVDNGGPDADVTSAPSNDTPDPLPYSDDGGY